MSILLGLDIGGTKSAAVIGTESGQVLDREEFATSAPELTISRLIESARRLGQGHAPIGCGISCGGPLSSREGLILSPPNLPGWDRVPVVARVQEALQIPTALENDANAAAVAEWRWGLSEQVDDLVYLTCGTGQGAGIILGGRLYRGRQDLAGEIGHVRLLPDGPVGYHKAGSIEGLTSGRALGELAKLRLQRPHPGSRLDEVEINSVTGRTVGELAVAGDELAVEVVRELAGHLGHACAVLIDLLNPQRISLGSLAVRLKSLLLDPVREAARQEALPAAYAACTIDAAALGDRVQDLAALAVTPAACTHKTAWQ